MENKGKGRGQAKEPASQCARFCQNYPLANCSLVSPRSQGPQNRGVKSGGGGFELTDVLVVFQTRLGEPFRSFLGI